MRLFVDGLPPSFESNELVQLFKDHGTVLQATVGRDLNGKSLRYGFVDMATKEAAEKAIRSLHRSELEGRMLLVLVSIT
jgi:RNA recognition motif-containing protein